MWENTVYKSLTRCWIRCRGGKFAILGIKCSWLSVFHSQATEENSIIRTPLYMCLGIGAQSVFWVLVHKCIGYIFFFSQHPDLSGLLYGLHLFGCHFWFPGEFSGFCGSGSRATVCSNKQLLKKYNLFL